MNKPTLDFIGIGAARSGTTWLHECLKEHPDVCVPTPKELHFFCEKTLMGPANWGLGMAWYSSKFSDCGENQIKGEISTSYLADAGAPSLIKKHFPDIKLIVSYRNPVDALYSYYCHVSNMYSLPGTFEETVSKRKDFIDSYRYALHTKRYLKYFLPEQMHFIIFDEIERDSRKVLEGLYEFLGVDRGFKTTSAFGKVNRAGSTRFPLLRDALSGTKVFLDQYWLARKAYKLAGVEELGAKLIKWNTSNTGETLLMRADTRLKFTKLYAQENEELGELIGKETKNWNKVS